jgi:stage V sporulation protein G
MQITDIKIRKAFEDGPMKAVVSVTFDNQFAVHDIKVIYANEKHFIVMPSRKNADGTYRDIAHPINAEFRAMIEKEVLASYFEQADALLASQAEEAQSTENEF